MKRMCTRTHGTLDYIWGTVLIASPWLFDFVTYDSIMWVPVLYGGFIFIYSFFTTYERGGIADITMKTHLWLDRTGGIFLMLSPWLFGFAQTTYVPHLLLGLSGLAISLITERTPESAPHRIPV